MLLGPYLAACVLLCAAGLAKLRRPDDTARALVLALHGSDGGDEPLGSARRRRLATAVRLGAGAEAALGLAALLRPNAAAAGAVALSYASFAAFVELARWRGGPLATCGCFGAPDTAPTGLHAALDLFLAVAAATVADHGAGSWPALLWHHPLGGLSLLGAALVLAWLSWALLGPYGKLAAARQALADDPVDSASPVALHAAGATRSPGPDERSAVVEAATGAD